jgi:acyl-coenzyme A synthetase/AMP-(fatty) acid ligase
MAQLFNACEYLLDRRLAAGDGDRLALTGPAGDLSYASLWDRVRRTAAGLRAVGAGPEQRILMVMADSPDFAVVYLAALRVGAIPVPVSTMASRNCCVTRGPGSWRSLVSLPPLC